MVCDAPHSFLERETMKRGITLSIALALSVLASLVSLPATTDAQQRQRFRVDSGVLTPGVGQILRITVVGTGGNDAIAVRFRRTRYMPVGCNTDGVCRHSEDTVTVTAPLPINNEAAVMDVPGDGNGVRIMAEWGSTREVRVIAQIIDVATGKVIAITVPNESTKLD